MSTCRQMIKLYCDIIKIRGKYGEKMEYYKLKSPIYGKVYTESCIRCYGSKFTNGNFLSFSVKIFPLRTSNSFFSDEKNK